MKLIIIYGPPSVGKLTVAKELAKVTGFKLFHNHLSIEFIETVLDFGTDVFWETLSNIRIEILKSALIENINLIFTFVYEKNVDDNFIDKLTKIVKNKRGKIYFVQLIASEEILLKRTKSSSRKKYYHKIRDAKLLRKMLTKSNIRSSIEKQNNLTIDNTYISPKNVVKIIVEHFGFNEKNKTRKNN